ncbi:Forkhead box protein P4 [Homalodisca vitripennis]|nr:Forkhead box protein P4 [Homalodisca vitripennis]
MQQLQERLQMNLIQQTHLVSQQSPDTVKSSDTLHQMAFQQQQLVHHLQMTQRRYVLQHGMNLQPAALNPPPQGKLTQTNNVPLTIAVYTGGDMNALWNSLNPTAPEPAQDKPPGDKGIGGINDKHRLIRLCVCVRRWTPGCYALFTFHYLIKRRHSSRRCGDAPTDNTVPPL